MAVAAIWSLLRTMGPIVGGLDARWSRRAARPLALRSHRPRHVFPLRSWRWRLAVDGCSAPCWCGASRSDAGLARQRALASPLLVHPHRAGGRLLRRRDLRLHGGADRLVQQPDFRRRHPGGGGLLRCPGAAFSPAAGAKALVAFALFITAILFAARLQLQRQSAGPEDRPAGRRRALAPAGGAAGRRRRRVAGHSLPCSICWPRPTALPARANLHTVTAQPLAAPQANLITALAQGVIGGKLNWSMIGIGAADRRRHRGAGRTSAAGAAGCACRRWRWASASICPCRRPCRWWWARSSAGSTTAACADRACRAAGRADGLRHDRGRKPVRRAQCRADRGASTAMRRWRVVPADFAGHADRRWSASPG